MQIIFAMGFATVVAVLLSRLAVVKRLQALEARFSLRITLAKCCKKRADAKQSQDSAEDGQGVGDDGASAENDSLIVHSEPESEDEDSGIADDHVQLPEAHVDPPSYWLRFQYSLLFVFFASQFELSNAVLELLRPCQYGYMAAHPWIACSWTESTQYLWLQVLAYAFLTLYVVGIPAAFCALLFWNRAAIREGSEEVEQRMGFLYETYKHEVFFFEVIWLLRRGLLSVSVALIPGSSAFRPAAIALILLASLFVQQRFRPFSSRVVNALEIVSTTALLYTFFVGSLIAAQDESSTFRDVMQTMLWVLNALVVVSLGVALVAPAVKRIASRWCCRPKQSFKLK
jgi:hypothetical protein